MTLGYFWRDSVPLPSQEQIRQSPYAVMAVQVGEGNHTVTVKSLEFAERSEEVWFSADSVAFVLGNGRLHQLLNHYDVEMIGWRSQESDPLPRMPQLDKAAFVYEVDLPRQNLFGTRVETELVNRGIELQQLGDNRYETTRVEEHVRIPVLNFVTVNTYWVDNLTGLVVRSVQNLPPAGTEVKLEVLKPDAG